MNGESRAPGHGPPEPPLRPIELFVVTAAPEYDDDVKEWKVTGVPIRSQFGLVSGSGDWVGGGHRGEGGVKRRWREENAERESTLWLPSWPREGDTDEASVLVPNLAVDDRIYAASIDGYLHIITAVSPLDVDFELLEALAQFSGNTVTAARKTWDPTANAGAGGYTVDCDDIILVGDFNEVGHNASKGGFGRAHMERREDGTLVGVIYDLCCPSDEMGACP